MNVEDGVRIYEVGFQFGNMEYDSDIRASSGEILTYKTGLVD